MPIDRSLERDWGEEKINQQTCKKGDKGGIEINDHSIRGENRSSSATSPPTRMPIDRSLERG
jgi:hypothetical protein